jgi:peroxiredoxin
MTTRLRVGDAFPDFELPDHRKRQRRLSGYTRPSPLDEKLGFDDGYPLILVFGRGFFCPRDQEQMRGLVRFQSELAVNYCRLVTVSADPPMVSAAFRAGLGAQWPFLSDEKREVIRRIDILDETEGEYARTAQPHTFVLRPDLTIHRIYDGWFFVGRPTLEELRRDLREIMQTRKDYRHEAYDTPRVKSIRIPQQEWEGGPPPLGANGFEVARGVVLIFGFGLAAAGLLPRLEYQTLSSLANGYGNIEGVRAAWGGNTLDDVKRLLVPGLVYPGLGVLALALAAPLIARGKHAVPFFVGLALCALTLAGQNVTLLHSVLYHVLPGFDWMHPHGPERIKVILYLAFALLAGATLSSLGEQGKRAGALVALPALVSLFLVTRVGVPPPPGGPAEMLAGGPGSTRDSLLTNLGLIIPVASLMSLAAVNICVVAYTLAPTGRQIAASLVVFVVFVDLFTAGMATVAGRATAEEGKRLVKIDLAQFYEPTGAAKFLRSETRDEPARYFGYGPPLQDNGTRIYHYNNEFTDPNTMALLASNLATPQGLQSIQGYNAVHLASYDEYIRVLNGLSQGYHNTDVYPSGLGSPLLDLLNVRYIVVPRDTQPDQAAIRELKDTHPTVYSDDQVEVLENSDALPRAWIVHSARETSQKEALDSLSSRAIDPRRTALLERHPPDLAEPDEPSADRTSFTSYEDDRIQLKTNTGAPSLLMLSEMYYPAWKAYVDGRPVSLYKGDYMLRAVPVPAGDHTVELRYESPLLNAGVAISLVFYAALVGLVVASVRSRRIGRDKA